MNKILRILAIAGVVSMLLVVHVGCAASSLKSIAASPDKVTLAVNGTQQLTITATYTKGSPKDVTAKCTYKSSDDKIATVTEGGLIQGIAAGSATITVSRTRGEITKTATVSVTVK